MLIRARPGLRVARSARYATLVDPSNSITPGKRSPPGPPVPQTTTHHSDTTDPFASRSRFPPKPPLPPKPAMSSPEAAAPRAIDSRHKETLDAFLLQALASLVAASSNGTGTSAAAPGYTTLWNLVDELSEKAGTMVDEVLAYESTPRADRRVKVPLEAGEAAPGPCVELKEGEQDGIVLIAHVVGGDNPSSLVCTGFAIGDEDSKSGHNTIMTCSHTLQAMAQRRSTISPHAPSATFAITSTSHVYPIDAVLSSLPALDLLLLRTATEPLRNPSWTLPTTASVPRLKTLPVSPYPSVVGSPISILRFEYPTENRDFGAAGGKGVGRTWKSGRVVGYKDAIGRESETGTYDDLSALTFSQLPEAGSSGGPIVDAAQGAVCGIVRGSSGGYAEKSQRGFGTPAEKIFEMYQLPGFTKASSRRAAEAEAEAATDRKPE